MPATSVKSAWSGGDLYFYDKSGNEILHIDGANRKLSVPSGSALEVAGVTVDSSTLAMTGLTAVAAELNSTTGLPVTVTISPAASGANVSLVTITVKDAAGVALANVYHLELWLSDAATGIGITGTTASGNVVAGAAGALHETITAKKHLRVTTSTAGVFILSITDAAKTQFYVTVKHPLTGQLVVAQVLTANYG